MPGACRGFPGQAQFSDESIILAFGKQDVAAGLGASGNAGMKAAVLCLRGIHAAAEETGCGGRQ